MKMQQILSKTIVDITIEVLNDVTGNGGYKNA